MFQNVAYRPTVYWTGIPSPRIFDTYYFSYSWCVFDSSKVFSFFMDTVWILFHEESRHYPDTWTTWTGYYCLFKHLGRFSCLSGKKKKLEKNSKKWWKCAAALVHSWCTFHGKKIWFHDPCTTLEHTFALADFSWLLDHMTYRKVASIKKSQLYKHILGFTNYLWRGNLMSI